MECVYIVTVGHGIVILQLCKDTEGFIVDARVDTRYAARGLSSKKRNRNEKEKEKKDGFESKRQKKKDAYRFGKKCNHSHGRLAWCMMQQKEKTRLS